MSSTALTQIDARTRALAQAETVEEVTHLRDWSKAAVEVAKALGDREAAQDARELQLRSERKAGKFLLEMEKSTGARGIGTAEGVRSSDSTTPTLADLGISKYDSASWQKLALLPDEEFEQKIAALKAETELTQAALLKEAKEWIKADEYRRAQEIIADNLLPEHKDYDLTNIKKERDAEVFASYYDAKEDKELVILVAQVAQVRGQAHFRKAIKNEEDRREREALLRTPKPEILDRPDWIRETWLTMAALNNVLMDKVENHAVADLDTRVLENMDFSWIKRVDNLNDTFTLIVGDIKVELERREAEDE